MWLIVGLGNPGLEYADTYHNAGFRVVEELAGRFGVPIRIRCGPALISSRAVVKGVAKRMVKPDDAASDGAQGAEGAEDAHGTEDAVLVLPQTFMNLTGSALPRLFERFEAGPSSLIAVYDDAALPLGKLRIRQKGSAGGHNGVKSIISSCGSDAFLRVRIGILPERPIGSLHDFVLSRVARADRDLMSRAEAAAADAVEALLTDGPAKAMDVFNRLDLRDAEEK